MPRYSSGLSTNERDLIEGRFTGRYEPECQALLCTSAFGMGLDIPDVRAVVNWQFAPAVEDYVQEIRRGGRDGRPALSLLFTHGNGESNRLEVMARLTCDGLVSKRHRTRAETDDVLAEEHARIAEMNALAHGHHARFREAVLDVLQPREPDPNRSLAVRVAGLAFGNRQRVVKPRRVLRRVQPPYRCRNCARAPTCPAPPAYGAAKPSPRPQPPPPHRRRSPAATTTAARRSHPPPTVVVGFATLWRCSPPWPGSE